MLLTGEAFFFLHQRLIKTIYHSWNDFHLLPSPSSRWDDWDRWAAAKWQSGLINRNKVPFCLFHVTDLMIEMEDHTNDLSEGRIPFLDYKTYTDRVFFLTSKDGANDVMITGRLEIPQARRATVKQALNQFSNLLNSKTFLINVITPHLPAWNVPHGLGLRWGFNFLHTFACLRSDVFIHS